jgi:glycosyltransferase involved in cell wall biosynthesis
MRDGRPVRWALVHDWLNQAGGAEVVLGVLHECYPAAPVYTTIHDPGRLPLPGWDLRVSWLNAVPFARRHHQALLPLYPLAWDSTRLRGFDAVLSNKSGFCHGVRTGGATHVCYCLTPTRFVWDAETYVAHEALPPGARLALRALLPWLRRWDLAAARRVDHFVAISSAVRQRIAGCYGRDSTVIHPPAEVAAERPGPPTGDYYLCLGRLVPYKRLDLAVAAFNELGLKLVVVGDGRDRGRLEALAGPTVQFRGHLPQAEVGELLRGCRGLVWPGVEDYGLAPVEAMAAGRPVLARRAGGVLDTVVDGLTGLFFDDRDDASALAEVVRRAEAIAWEPAAIHAHARRFGREVFEARLGAHLAEVLADRPAREMVPTTA